MRVDNINDNNFCGNIIKTKAQTLPKKVQRRLSILSVAIGHKPYDVSLSYSKKENILDFMYTQADAKVKQYKHSVNYTDKVDALSEMIEGSNAFEKQQMSKFQKKMKGIETFICKNILKI